MISGQSALRAAGIPPEFYQVGPITSTLAHRDAPADVDGHQASKSKSAFYNCRQRLKSGYIWHTIVPLLTTDRTGQVLSVI